MWYNAASMPLIECIPNISEGRRLDIVRLLTEAVSSTPGVHLLDVSSDACHNRSVLTFVGEGPDLQRAVVTLAERARDAIDLRSHRGQHPRIGALDVVPFVPLDGATMADCIQVARDTARQIADQCGVPVFLYEHAATAPARRNLADLRRGGFESLRDRLAREEWAPDFGPSTPHPTAGVTAIGARQPLIAFNVNLADNRLDIARAVAVAVRESSGGLPNVKAIPIALDDRHIVQVSMNLTDYRRTSVEDAFLAVEAEAARRGVTVLESEIVGLIPAAALPASLDRLRLTSGSANAILEDRLHAALGTGRRPSEP
jgi:glutamate formiminotransferase / 5-formyltetrahydrofolate cyclo-ligase